MAGAEFVPKALPCDSWTFVAETPITAGQVVYVSGPLGVSASTGSTAAQCGVAAQSVAPGQTVAVYLTGLHGLAASGAIAAGDPVTAAANGAVADIGTSTAYDQIIGRAFTAAAPGGVVQVRIGR